MERGRRSPSLGRRWQQLRTTCLPSSSSCCSSTNACSSPSSSCSSRSNSSRDRRQRATGALQTGHSSSSRRSSYTSGNSHRSHTLLCRNSSRSNSSRSNNSSSSRSRYGGGLFSLPSALLLLLFLMNLLTPPSSVVSLSLQIPKADTRMFSSSPPSPSPSLSSSSSFSRPSPSHYNANSLVEANESAAAAATANPPSDSSSFSFTNPTTAPAPAASGFTAASASRKSAAASSSASAKRVLRLVPLAFCAATTTASPAAAATYSSRTRRRSRTRARLFAAEAATTSAAGRHSHGTAAAATAGDAAAAGGGSSSRSFMKPRIVCTGLGVVNGVGVGIDEFWRNVVAGKNVVGNVTRFDPAGMSCQVACEVPDSMFDPVAFFRDPKEVKRNDRYSHFAMAAARLAMEDAGLGPDGAGLQRDRFGVVIGSGIGGLQWMEQELRVLLQKGPRRVSPLLIPAMIANTASAVVAIDMKAEGPNHGAVSACATSGHATGTALRYLQAGEADIILCGGAEASITPLSFAGFNAMRAMAQGFNDSPKAASRPFDKKRAGFVMGEGAGVMVLETEEHAVRRGASKIYGEVAGYGATCDAHHVTAPAPDGAGLARCLQKAITEAGVAKEDVGYINAHGTSTPMNDRIETRAIKSVFGEEGARKLLISSTKSMTGHCLGATGGIEACVAAKVLETGIVPPTINYEEPDPDCDLNYVPNQAVTSPTPFEAVISDTLGFGGHNAALLLRRYRGMRQ